MSEPEGACEAAHDRGEHRWEDHLEASLDQLLKAVHEAGLTITPDESPDFHALDCEVPLRLDDRTGVVRTRARALLMEMHGTTGCDPNCVARYHEMFPSLTDDEYRAAVGDLRGTWPDGTPA